MLLSLRLCAASRRRLCADRVKIANGVVESTERQGRVRSFKGCHSRSRQLRPALARAAAREELVGFAARTRSAHLHAAALPNATTVRGDGMSEDCCT